MTDAATKKGRRTLLLMAALFIGPLVAAWLLYFTDIWQPGGGANHGELVQPVVTLPRSPQPMAGGGYTEGGFLYGKWTLVHLVDGACDEACRAAVYKTRQIRLALGREVERIDRVAFLRGLADADFGAGREDLLVVKPAGEAGDETLEALQANGGAARIFLVDPLGNLILSYPRDGEPSDIRDDLKKLLRLSRIG